MLQVYVTEMPKKSTECPFFNDSNKKCNMSHEKCCLNTKEECQHLLTLEISFDELEEVK